jgi:hypothetical protein
MTGHDRNFVLKFATDLVNASERAATLKVFCAKCGLQSLLLFIPDEEVGAMLVAPGFPQTLPEGGGWREFLSECTEKGEAETSLPWPTSGHVAKASGISAAFSYNYEVTTSGNLTIGGQVYNPTNEEWGTTLSGMGSITGVN